MAISWHNAPPDGKQLTTLPIVRPKPGTRPIEGVILSTTITGVLLHWLGRSVPHIAADPNCKDCDALATPPVHCPAHACDGCERGRPYRWEGYLHLWHPEEGRSCIVAVTPGVQPAFETYADRYTTIRGARAKFTRNGFKPQSPINVILKESGIPAGTLPREVDLRPILENVWGVGRTPEQPAKELERVKKAK